MIRGVNLGGWLVLEKWLTPSVFAGYDDASVPDEYTLCLQGGKAKARLRQHHQTFITKKDFGWLAAQGINAVRIPVGYWLFGDVKPYIGAIDCLDKAFDWAQAAGIGIVLSIHGAPGSQNGEMHSGRQGDTGWAADPANCSQTLTFVERLAQRYKDAPALIGIGLLNEPSAAIPKTMLAAYYRQGYRLIRRICGPHIKVIVTDIYKPRQWNWRFMWPVYRGIWLDSHQYQVFTARHKQMTVSQHLTYTNWNIAWQLIWLRLHHTVIVGEWSAALDRLSLPEALHDRETAYASYADCQIRWYNRCNGWFYWTYKTEQSDINPWDYRQMIRRGIIKPQKQ